MRGDLGGRFRRPCRRRRRCRPTGRSRAVPGQSLRSGDRREPDGGALPPIPPGGRHGAAGGGAAAADWRGGGGPSGRAQGEEVPIRVDGFSLFTPATMALARGHLLGSKRCYAFNRRPLLFILASSQPMATFPPMPRARHPEGRTGPDRPPPLISPPRKSPSPARR